MMVDGTLEGMMRLGKQLPPFLEQLPGHVVDQVRSQSLPSKGVVVIRQEIVTNGYLK